MSKKNSAQKASLWKYIKADVLFKEHLPHIKNYKRKIIEKNTRSNPVSFTDQEQNEIRDAIRKIMGDLDNFTLNSPKK